LVDHVLGPLVHGTAVVLSVIDGMTGVVDGTTEEKVGVVVGTGTMGVVIIGVVIAGTLVREMVELLIF
jgi:hypothetical protein